MTPKTGDIIRIDRPFRVWAADASTGDKVDYIVGDIPPVLTLYLSPGNLCIVLGFISHRETPIHDGIFEMKILVDGKRWSATLPMRFTDKKLNDYFTIVGSTDALSHRSGGES
tara:strand:+ start:121 stop:459 length:339 start_codon:yes stop_codon:yes gene_type:complete